jgi:hypothetical protein
MKWYKIEHGTRGLVRLCMDPVVEGSDVDIKKQCRDVLYAYMFESLISCDVDEQGEITSYFKKWSDIIYKEGIVYLVVFDEETSLLYINEDYVAGGRINDSDYLSELIIWVENDLLKLI